MGARLAAYQERPGCVGRRTDSVRARRERARRDFHFLHCRRRKAGAGPLHCIDEREIQRFCNFQVEHLVSRCSVGRNLNFERIARESFKADTMSLKNPVVAFEYEPRGGQNPLDDDA